MGQSLLCFLGTQRRKQSGLVLSRDHSSPAQNWDGNSSWAGGSHEGLISVGVASSRTVFMQLFRVMGRVGE